MTEQTQQVNEIRELIKALDVTIKIECVACGGDECAEAKTEWAAASEFHKEGWRIEENEAECPECRKVVNERQSDGRSS